MHTLNETHEIEIESDHVLGEKVKLQRATNAGKPVIFVRLSTRDYNGAIPILPEQLLLAARTLVELPEPIDKSANLQRVLDEVAAERARQNALCESGEIPFTCADPNVSPGAKTAPIMEEVIEVLKEIQMLNSGSTITVRDAARRQLRIEAIQAAACFTALAESLQP